MNGKLAILATVLVAAAPAYAAVNVTSSASTTNPAGLPATYDFNSATPQYSGTIFNNSVGNVRAQPVGSTGGYAAVGPGNDVGPTFLDLSSFGDIASITFLWGSVDTYNTVELIGAIVPTIITGGNSGVAPATGDQSTDRLVTFTLSGLDRSSVTGLKFSSTQDAFEFDNVNVVTAAVPEMATWAMMVGGFGLLGAASRRQKKASVRFI